MSTAAPAQSIRDPRLDFFRGLAMFIILIAHVPGNWLTLWIPARFGFSDATETFVFCSGMASAIAFGRAFRDQGMAIGTARVGFRIWQVYWAHIGLFFAIAVTMVALNTFLPDPPRNYVGQLNLTPFFRTPDVNLLGLMTLTYVPNYFDILPMYLVILAMMPIMILLVRIHLFLGIAFSLALWLGAQADILAFPAEPWSEREWFFNPFGWQLVFYTGFALMAGWFRPPPVTPWLIALAVAIILLSLPFAYFRIYRAVEWASESRQEIAFFRAKTDFGLFRYIHFLATAYLAWVIAGPKGARLIPKVATGLGLVWSRVLTVILTVGQQSLAVFVASMYLARLMGVALDLLGRTHLTMALVNIGGAGLIIAVAYTTRWFKAKPWSKRAAPQPAAPPKTTAAPAE